MQRIEPDGVEREDLRFKLHADFVLNAIHAVAGANGEPVSTPPLFEVLAKARQRPEDEMPSEERQAYQAYVERVESEFRDRDRE